MYTPAHNRETDQAQVVGFMQEYNFATLVTSKDDQLQATHLPFLVESEGQGVRLLAHMARANNQWHDFTISGEVMVIFQEPHAFISTRHYEKFLSVPTWNYIAVHAYGRVSVVGEYGHKLALVEKTVQQFEGNLEHWRQLPPDFVQAKLDGIVAFEIEVTRLLARFKLSQDRTPAERERIVEALTGSPDGLQSKIGELMKRTLTD
jgi:transcriptional regulator